MELRQMGGIVFHGFDSVRNGLRRVGDADQPRAFSLKTKTLDPVVLQRVSRLFPEVLEYAMPPRDAEAERTALHANFSHFKKVKTSENLRRRVRETIIEDSPKVASPRWLPPDGIPSDEAIMGAIQGLNPEANAGFPYLLSGSKKKEFAENNFPFVSRLVKERMLMILAFSSEMLRRMEPWQLVLAGLMDPLRPIVKNEPHKLSKITEGRYRLVICISLVDEIIDRLLFTSHSTAMVENFAETYSAIGIGFDDDKTEKLRSSVKLNIARGGPVASSDVKHWEYSCQEEDYDEFARVTIGSTLNPTASYAELVEKRCILMSKGVYVLEDGELWEQVTPGVTKSGGYQTARFNTITRARKSRMVGSNAQTCAGDDCVERPVLNAVQRYLRLGVVVKDYMVSNDFEFCSHDYHDSGPPIPKNLGKAVVRYVANGPSAEKLEQFVYEYQHAPRLEDAVVALLSVSLVDPSDPVEDN